MQNIILIIKASFYSLFLNPSIILKIVNGKLIVVKGSPKTSFMYDCNEIIKHNSITSGIIYAKKGQYGHSDLYCSSEIQKEAVQQFRNSWSFNR